MSALLRQFVRQTLTAQSHGNRYCQMQALRCLSATKDTTESTTKTFNKETLDKLVTTNKVVIFMKGNPEAPRCGFSNAVVQILRMHGVQYDAHDVLLSEELRQGVKEYTEWPTIPQVFIGGQFVGGCDILLQMHQSGDLIEELKKAGIESVLLKQAEEKAKAEAAKAATTTAAPSEAAKEQKK